MWMSTECSKQCGASALEASVAVVPVLLVCLLGLELVHAHQVKQLASLALHEAGREASVSGAEHKRVNQAFARAFAPRFAPAGQAGNASQRQDATIGRYQRLYALPLWQLELTDIKSWGTQPHIFRAVELELLYLHEPLQPWLRKVLKQSVRWLSASPSGLTAKAQQQGLIAMRLTRRAVIHSNSAQRPQSTSTPKVRQTTIPDLQRSDSSVKRHQPETQTQASAFGPKDQLGSIAESVGPTKALTVVPLKPEKEDLCGVLLCCAP